MGVYNCAIVFYYYYYYIVVIIIINNLHYNIPNDNILICVICVSQLPGGVTSSQNGDVNKVTITHSNN